jgi:multiple sugar transport system permease protein
MAKSKTFETATRTLISPARLNRPAGKRIYWTMVIVVVALFTFVFLGPLYWMITGGLKTATEFVSYPPDLTPKHPSLDAYKSAWSALGIGQLLVNTIYYAFGALAFQLIFDIAAAFAFSKLRPAGGKIILGMMLATLMIPSTVLIIPQYVNIISLPIFHWNMLNSPFAIWLPAVTNAFNIFLLKRFFDSIPEDLISAAAIDGAGALRTLWSIILPMSRPIIGVVSIFSVTAVWKDYLWPHLAEPAANKSTINVGIFAFSANLPPNVVIAAAVMAAVPTIVFFLIFQRNIMSGLTTGSLKG